jgi:hypothetical protein
MFWKIYAPLLKYAFFEFIEGIVPTSVNNRNYAPSSLQKQKQFFTRKYKYINRRESIILWSVVSYLMANNSRRSGESYCSTLKVKQSTFGHRRETLKSRMIYQT